MRIREALRGAQTSRAAQAPLLAAALAAASFGTAALAGWLEQPSAPAATPASSAAAEEIAPVGALRRAKPRCPECGVVEDMYRIEATEFSPETYAIAVRMRDGSIQVTSNPTPADWRPGERIMIIGPDSPDAG